jgi:hypothetical protein
MGDTCGMCASMPPVSWEFVKLKNLWEPRLLPDE